MFPNLILFQILLLISFTACKGDISIKSDTNKEMSAKRALVFLAKGAEEMETVITVDVLRRAGILVTLAGVEGADAVLCSRDVRVVPDVALSSVENDNFDAVIVPGGLKGAETCASVRDVLKNTTFIKHL
jgi:putative intracellular protease/amidase